MRLSSVRIKNFRSIKECEVKFDPTCRVLVGINESGKSNILHALAFLSDKYVPVKKDDLREPSPDGEGPIDSSHVWFIFKFEKPESDKLLELVSEKIACLSDNPKVVSDGKTEYKLKDYCATRTDGLYIVNILAEKKTHASWTLPKGHELAGQWLKPSKACPPNYVYELDGISYQLANFKLVNAIDFKNVQSTYLEEATIEDLSNVLSTAIRELTEENLPQALFWEYDEKNLLPGSVKITEFANNPDSCAPLKNMFVLAGHNDIRTAIEDAKKGSSNQFQNFFDRIANQTTAHFRNVWKDYKGVAFTLKLNADQIIPGIKELNSFDLTRRSDGFKRFVTFLLMISANVECDDLRNALLLIDEPETGLHPTGSRYLRDELIRISKKNYVVYSTHSIFMIDPSEIGRHYLVKKKDEITTIEPAKIDSNVAEEEVIYNALGYSVFQTLKKQNIIFEGWKDKQLFEVALEHSNAETKRSFKEVGICHARGSSSIKAMTPMMELAERQCLIVSDSDRAAKDQQKLYKKEKGYGKWCTYQDIDNEIEALTGEDFLKNDYIAKQVQSFLDGPSLPRFEIASLPESKGKLLAIKQWLLKNGFTDEQTSDMLVQIKDALFDNLKPSHIENSYSKLLDGIKKEIS